jgi:hypothetical protein
MSQAGLAQFSQQGPKLVGPGAIYSSQQGISVALSSDGTTAIVGGNNDGSVGAAWVFVRAGGTWTPQAKLVPADAVGPFVQLGISVALSYDGNTAIVGGFQDSNDVGAAWVFTRNGSVWSEQAKLVGTGVLGSGALQGFSVALSADGNIALIGGYADNSGVGAAWVFTRSGGLWAEQAKLVGADAVGNAFQGYSVTLSASGDTAIVGGFQDSGNVGAAWVFVRTGNAWFQQSKLVGAGGVGDTQQGFSVALSADGNTAIVGGNNDSQSPLAAWIFIRSGNSWTQQSMLVGSGAIGSAFHGTSVSLSADGNTAVIGGPFNDGGAGTAWVFTRSGTTWSELNKLTGTGAVGFAAQGRSVALSADGSTAIVGGPNDNGSIGAAWVFATPAGALQVSPAADIAMSGTAGGPFSPSSVQYQLSSTSGVVGYFISGLPGWLTASRTTGTATTSPSSVTFAITPFANTLAPNTYNASISFINTTNSQVNQTRMATLTVTAPTPAQQIAALETLIESFNLSQGIDNSLDAKLNAALAALAAARSNSMGTTCNQLGAFLNYTQAQSGYALTVDQANQLVSSGTQIRVALGCS